MNSDFVPSLSFARILDLARANQLSGQQLLLQQALYEDSKNYELLFALGLNLSEVNRFDDAIDIFNALKKYQNQDQRVLYNMGLIYAINHDHHQAIACYDQVLKDSPQDIGTLVNKCASLIDLGDYVNAQQILATLIEIDPSIPQAWMNKGILFKKQGLYQEAITAYDEVLKLNKNFHEAWFNKALSLSLLKRYEEALAHYDRALQLKPDYTEAWFNRGVSYGELKRYEEALTDYDHALQLKPDYAEAWHNKGVNCGELKRYEEALAHYDHALQLKPNYAEAWFNKALSLSLLKRYEEALAHYDRALQLKPDYTEAWFNRGVSYGELKRYEEALTDYDHALQLKPDYAEAWHNKGVNCGELKRYEEALAHYDHALQLKPNYAEAWYNKGTVFSELGHHEHALVCYENAKAINPNLDWLLGQLVHTKMLLCKWSNLSPEIIELRSKVQSGAKAVQPFAALSLFDSAEIHQTAAKVYVKAKYALLNPMEVPLKRERKGKIRVGYFSSDFQNHPVAYLTAELFELHDREKYEIFAFSFTSASDCSMRQRLEKAFDCFIDLDNTGDFEAALLIRNYQIDIAVDLGGFTQNARSGIFAYRIAPIQIGYIGYLGTLGAEYMDYLIGDKALITDESLPYISEKILYLPCYQVNDRKKFQGDKQVSRSDFGLPLDSFIFCCFNNNYKINPRTFDSWMNILKAVDKSVLYLFADNEVVKKNLKKEALLRGIEGERIVFGGCVDRDEYLSRYQVADLFLDTAPYNAGTTASDALWVGLPVLTLIGQSFASRMAASILNAIDLPELITYTQEEYENLAIELALKPEKLMAIKTQLSINKSTSMLFNTPLFAKNLEKAYEKIYIRYQSGLPPEHTYVS